MCDDATLARDPETVAHNREQADWGEFEVVIEHDDHGRLGTLDETFENDYDAHRAAKQAAVPDVNVTTTVQEVTDGTAGTLHFDGASRGNPGDAAIGYVIEAGRENGYETDHARVLPEEHTNNYAEYKALLEGVKQAVAEGVTDLTIHGDSEVIIKQVRGEYDCNADHLQPLLSAVESHLRQLDDWTIEHVDRSKNSTADAAANRALDEADP